MVEIIHNPDYDLGDAIGHICIYLCGHEMHTDISTDEIADLESLATAIGEFVTFMIKKELTNADLGPASVQ